MRTSSKRIRITWCAWSRTRAQIGRGHLDRFMDVETLVPTVVTTSQMLTTGVDVPTCQNVVLARVINSMTDFKQIIGRGTRVRDDYGKLFFNILDYTGSATRLFADPDFDGEPALITEEEMDETGKQVEVKVVEEEKAARNWRKLDVDERIDHDKDSEARRRKYYVDNGSVEIAAHLVYELDANGKQLRVVKFTDYTAEKVRSMCPSAASLRSKWSKAEERAEIIQALEDRGISFERTGDGGEAAGRRPVRPAVPCRVQRAAADAPGTGGDAAAGEEGLFRPVRPRSARGARPRCSTSTSSTALRSSRFRRFSKCRPFPNAARFRRSRRSSAARKECALPCSEMQALLYAS